MKIQAVKCPECGAKISEDAVQSSRSAVCEYCGTLIVLTPEKVERSSSPSFRRPFPQFRKSGQRRPILRLINLLVRKDVIDELKFREAVKKNIQVGIPRLRAVKRTLKDMIRNGDIDKEKIVNTLDELVAEKKISPRAVQNVRQLLADY